MSRVLFSTGTRAGTALLAACIFFSLIANRADAQNNAEPTGGRWRPIAYDARSMTLAAPPAAGSAEETAEIQELLTLQNERTDSVLQTVRYWDAGSVLRWNEIARGLVIRYRTNPPRASRVYALLSIAQYDALVAAWRFKYLYQRHAPSHAKRALVPLVRTTQDPSYPSDHATVASVSAAILSYLYPAESSALAEMAREDSTSRLWAGVNFRSDMTAGEAIGSLVAQKVIERAMTDGSDAVWTGTVPVGDGYWTGVNPLLPLWGSVRTWLLVSGSQLRPAPPPAFGSPEFLAALAEVRQISDSRTPEQLRIAQFWADGAGTATPPGHWNQIACDLIGPRYTNELRTARALSLLNMAMMDAGICCWDAKYVYWLIRPSQADPLITTPVGLPNFPSYTSGHSTFSGAAAVVLGYLFPNQQAALRAMAEEAAISRIYGGIHYRFDSEVGLEGGRIIGQLAIERAKGDGAPR